MTNLQSFLLENSVNDITKEVILSKRLKDYPFKISCVDGRKMEEYQKQCIKNPGSVKKRDVDTQKFNELLILNHCISPNFKDADWLTKAGCPTDPKALLYKVLNAGEILTLSSEIQKLSGFDDSVYDEIADEVKNS